MTQKKILIVDDDTYLRELIADFLTMKGFIVLQAADGRKGLEAIKKEQPDLVLLDLVMPHMNGLELLAQLGDAATRPIIIMMSGNHEEEAAREAIRLGAYDYLTKPVSLEDLENNFIDRILDA